MQKHLFFSFIVFLLGWSACTQHEINPDDNKQFPLRIRVSKNTSGVELSWDEVRLSSFKEYVITRQLDTTGFNSVADTTWVIDDYKTTKIVDANPPIAQRIYYRLEARANSIKLKSSASAYEQKDIISINDVNFNTLFLNPIQKMLYILNIQNELEAFDMETQKFNKNKIGISAFSGFEIGSFSEVPNDLFIIENNQSARVLNPKTLDQKESFDIQTNGDFVQGIISNPDNQNLIYLSYNNSYGDIQVYDRTTKTVVQTYKVNSFFGSQKTLRFLPKINKLLLFDRSSGNSVVTYTLKPNGTIQSHKTNSLSSEWSGRYIISPTGNRIISLNTGNVYDENFKILSKVSLVNSAIPPCFSSDGKFIAFFNGATAIRIIDADTFKDVKTIPVNSSLTSSTKPQLAGYTFWEDKLLIVTARFTSNFNSRDLTLFFKDYK